MSKKIKKHCWKCDKISRFEETKIEYVAKRTGGTQWTCIECVNKFMKANNVKEVVRIDKEINKSMFNTYKFIENE